MEPSGFSNLYNFQVFEFSLVNRETDKGANRLPALQACGSGVDVQEFQLRVKLYLQDMAVSADKELRGAGVQLLTDARVVLAGIAADVRHQDVGSFAGPAELVGEHTPEVSAVNVSVYGS